MRGLFAGGTDYSHQGYSEMVQDLSNWVSALREVKTILEETKALLQSNGHWTSVTYDLKGVFEYCAKFFETSIAEIEEILGGIQNEVESYHVKRLRTVAKTAARLNDRLGDVWHNGFWNKEYGDANFSLLENMYGDSRDMVADLLDLDNLAVRLEDFVGWKQNNQLQFDPNTILPALWIIECDESMKQGTAFALAGTGLITCEHVLGTASHAFKPDNPSKKYPVTVLAKHNVIDLAILKIDSPISDELPSGNADSLPGGEAIAIAGFPNYQFGDTGVVIPGVIVGFRTVSSIRRILTNIPIIAGNSGGPVLNKNKQVIGVAVTGADRMENAQQTENHGIIPIDALQLISAS